jgi:hypothetical protein
MSACDAEHGSLSRTAAILLIRVARCRADAQTTVHPDGTPAETL